MKVVAILPAEEVNDIQAGALVRVVLRSVTQREEGDYRVELDIRPWDRERDRDFVDRLDDES